MLACCYLYPLLDICALFQPVSINAAKSVTVWGALWNVGSPQMRVIPVLVALPYANVALCVKGYCYGVLLS
jgi:hypothetical protein